MDGSEEVYEKVDASDVFCRPRTQRIAGDLAYTFAQPGTCTGQLGFKRAKRLGQYPHTPQSKGTSDTGAVQNTEWSLLRVELE